MGAVGRFAANLAAQAARSASDIQAASGCAHPTHLRSEAASPAPLGLGGAMLGPLADVTDDGADGPGATGAATVGLREDGG